ncbi:hypothetical protein BaRGS_00023316 [Batillaria attramentaria]|uniref:Uncharacterized protein n=1 Tax=Batillaria attramentaria TaxID=370345 RepID=A0ABD0KE29_9CAEN
MPVGESQVKSAEFVCCDTVHKPLQNRALELASLETQAKRFMSRQPWCSDTSCGAICQSADYSTYGHDSLPKLFSSAQLQMCTKLF